MVPGFPEITTHEPKCKLCQLVDTQRGLLKLAHRLRYEEELGNDPLRTRILPIFARMGQLPPSPRSIGRHFTEHVDFSKLPSEDAYAMPESIEASLERLNADAAELRATDPEEMALGDNNSDYHQLTDLFMRLQRRIAALDSDPGAFTAADGSHSFTKLRTWAALIDGARRIVEGLNKMRNSDRMTVGILEQHTRRFATEITRPVANHLRAIRNELTASSDPVAHRAVEQLTFLLDEGVTNIMVNAATQALTDVKAEYKLLN